MFFILLGITIFIFSVFFGNVLKWKEESREAIGIVALVVGVIIGLVWPVAGYLPAEEEVIEEVNFEYRLGNLVGIYWNEPSNQGKKTNYLSLEGVSVTEDASLETAKLVVITKEAKKTFWSFAVVPQVEYYLYVPPGTIMKNS